MARGKKTTKQDERAPQEDPRAPLDGGEFLTAAQPVLKLLDTDLLSRAKGSPAITAALIARHEAERAARRTADSFVEWQERFIAQVGAAWLLSCVFVRTLEDRGLVSRARIAGPGAADSERLFREQAPSLDAREYLLTVFRELTRFPASADLFDAKHNPVWLFAPSAEACRALLGLFRSPNADAPSFRFGHSDTRFLGDLYQDLNEGVRKRFALLQTPRFVESFILDRTLDPALASFGLDGTDLIDPTCGSGHFLLGAFDRLFDERLKKEPALGAREAARKALDAVYGSDINPYAVAIARFRLTLSFLEKGGYTRIADAPKLPLHIVVADSLLHNPHVTQMQLGDLAGQSSKAWKGEEFALEDEEEARAVLFRKYAAVVGNPPYIVVQDAVLREDYRKLYPSAFRQYSLGVPFTERFFQLGKQGARIGMITANSFMKREFGKKLITDHLPTVNLDTVINTAGAYIPGHGTPTVLLFGSAEAERGTDVLTVLASRGEPSTPEDPEQGLVWRSIADHWDEVGFENEYITVSRTDRTTLHQHPWSLGGGGAAELKALLEERAEKTLGDYVDAIGRTTVVGEDDVWIADAGGWARRGVDEHVVPFVVGECVRDWAIVNTPEVLYPYAPMGGTPIDLVPAVIRALWPWRRRLEARTVFGKEIKATGRRWWEHLEHYSEKLRTPLSIAFPFVATHNHFALDRGGKVFKQTAPIIKLPATATEDDHYALLAYLNSSTACFWMKQVFAPKGMHNGSEANATPFLVRFEFDGTKLARLPLPSAWETLAPRFARLGRELDRVSLKRRATLVNWAEVDCDSARTSFEETISDRGELLDRMIAVQEEIDWAVYAAFDLAPWSEEVDLTSERARLGSRPFELGLDAAHSTGGEWFEWLGAERGSLEEVGSSARRERVSQRLAAGRTSELRLLEAPESKRRWVQPSGKAAQELQTDRVDVMDHGRAWLADFVERQIESRTGVGTLREIRERLNASEALRACADILGESPIEYLTLESVPYIAAYRFSESGLDRHAEWQRTWELQRKEDGGEKGEVPVPPKYDPKDYRDASYYRLRGKLDVPKERFISYPGCESDEDHEPVYGWAGWNHEQRAKALATLYYARKTQDGWGKDRLTPMLAGLLELQFWLDLWHAERSDEYAGDSPANYYRGFLDGECRTLGLTHDDLRAWRPASKTKKAAKTAAVTDDAAPPKKPGRKKAGAKDSAGETEL